MAAVLFICSLFFLGALGSAPKPCTSPDLLEGQRYIGDLKRTFGEEETFSYDAVQKRIYLYRSMWDASGKKLAVMDIMLFQQSIRYQFYPQNKTCVKSALRTPFQRIAVPSNATFLSQIYLGGSSEPREGVLTNVWMLTTGDSEYCFLSFTESNCLPLSEVCFSKDKSWVFATSFNLTKTIQDPSVFNPPSECA
ncbi:mammalian ependymin-related protein 1-like isoform X2 [Chiloscyllium punctatum]